MTGNFSVKSLPFCFFFREMIRAAAICVVLMGIPVRFHGSYDPTEREGFLRNFFAENDYLLVPSQDEWETLSMATLEALQHGVPAVLCRAGGLKSFAHHQLGPAAEKVVRLVEPGVFPQTLVHLGARLGLLRCDGFCFPPRVDVVLLNFPTTTTRQQGADRS